MRLVIICEIKQKSIPGLNLYSTIASLCIEVYPLCLCGLFFQKWHKKLINVARKRKRDHVSLLILWTTKDT